MRGKRYFIIILSLFILFSATGCGNKNVLSVDDFNKKMEDKGYTVQDASSQMSEVKEIENVSIAIDKDQEYQIEFYKLDSADSAVIFFNENKEIFENSKTNNNSYSEANMANFSTYTLTTNDKYKLLSRIDNTVLYIDVLKDAKSEVKELVKQLGY